ncbi:TetR/AcrR family transcriptional regulator [Aequorivita marina]|uniref:TetR/AcrR family transcriptional regulator n=1 Tax=Aequorivita marina TaxID=3073654 RepID=UPI002875FC3D|nr:TetR/AcrR family transcriptional regulator [Aequorivita sp. S2608]MDS1299391.1 TetR/AcrR family transcriptional regulator [Aequorivita sp. S2608]
MHSKNHILEVARELFFSFGIKNISMDDIANKCGVSKKTIYKHFQSKDNLLFEVIKMKAFQIKKSIDKIQIKNDPAIQELQNFFELINGLARRISPRFGRELKSNHNSNLFKALSYVDEILKPFVIQNIEKGKCEGVYKEEIDARNICKSYENLAKAVYFNYYLTDSQMNSKSFDFLSYLFLYGLVSEIGWAYLQKNA